MIFPDYHLHSCFSSDCKTMPIDIINQAKAKGLTSVCFTDHHDIDFPILESEPDIDFQLDIEAYHKELTQLRDSVQDFDLKIGVELGVMPNVTDKAALYAKKHNELDFIICSTHVVDGIDPYYPEYFNSKTDKQGYLRYFEEILNTVTNFRDYNVYGHLDYIVRYGKNKSDSFDFSDYKDIMNEILKTIIDSGNGIEINTGSLYRGLKYPHPHKDILKMYKDLGGEIITIGSDSHDLEHIGYGFDVARELLLACDLSYYCTFSKRKPTFIKI